MKTLIAKTLTAVATTAVLSTAQAAVVTVGSLTRDTSAATISDSLNNRTWLGWDVTKGLTYAETLAAIGTGGQFEGYKIAHIDDAMLFATALLGTSNCTATTYHGQTCGTVVNPQTQAVTGDSYYDYAALGITAYEFDYVFFLSDNGTGAEVGLLESSSYSSNPSNYRLVAYNEFYTIAGTNAWSAASCSNCQIGWLLYSDDGTSNKVPEPGTLALTGLALLAATRLRRKA
jgi:hypothetical protein